jgi:hypothetical protein
MEKATSGAKDHELGHQTGVKTIPTVAGAAVYNGDFKTVATESSRKVPDNPEEVIARNTVGSNSGTMRACKCGCCGK